MTGTTATHRVGRRWSDLAFAIGILGTLVVPSAAMAALPRDDGDAPATPSHAQPRVQAPAGAASRPDIVVLVIDDLGDMDRRVFQRLPTIRQRFLRSGIEFRDYIGNDPLCCPGRATLLTGQRSGDHGVVINDPGPFDPRVTIATELDARGYHTLFAGKYFNLPQSIADRTPPGWDRIVFGAGYYAHTWFRNGRSFRLGTGAEDYTTDVIKRHATRWIREAPARPLLVWLTPVAVHGGTDEHGVLRGSQPVPARRHRGDPRCAGIEPWLTPAHTEADRSDKPAYVRALPIRRFADGYPLRTTCETLLAVDELLAATTRALTAEGRTNVLYVLVGDNGMAFGQHGWPKKLVPYAVPMPFYVQWSQGAGREPRVIHDTVTATDIAPTLCAVAGCVMGPFANGRPVRGISLLPLITGAGRPQREVIPIEHHRWFRQAGMPAWWGLRTTDRHPLGRWSYVRYATGEVELYDLENDPWQLDNRAGDRTIATTRQTLREAFERLHPRRR